MPEELDIVFDCQAYNPSLGIEYPGVITMVIAPSGAILSKWIISDTTISIVSSISGDRIVPVVIIATAIPITIDVKGTIWVLITNASWVWASRIGSMDFALDDSGETSRRPMPYGGVVYKIQKLGNTAIVYGENGITKMTPYGVNWGLENIHNIGIKGWNAICGNELKHYFIDKVGILYKLVPDEMPEKMDYSNLFSTLDQNTVMSYDERLDIAYITDGIYGYALSASGLGECPPTITGVGYKDGAFYVTSPSTITNSPFEITTDIMDFGVRTEKTIMGLDFGIAISTDIYAAIDYRWKKSDAWSTTPWRKIDNYGKVSFTLTAIEFRIKVKLTTYEDIQLDYINVFGKFIAKKAIEGAVYDTK